MRIFAAVVLALTLGSAQAAVHTARAPRHKPASKSKAPEPAPTPEPAPEPAAPESAPEPTPAAAETPPEKPKPAPEKAKASAEKPSSAATVAALRAEYDELRDQLFRSRARRETLESALISTQLLPTITWEGGRHHLVKHAEVRFDGIRLWETNEGGLTGDKPVALAPRSAPPGAHVLGVRVEVRSRDNPTLGYVSDQSFAVSLPEGKKTSVTISVDEDGSAPSYNPDIEIAVKSK